MPRDTRERAGCMRKNHRRSAQTTSRTPITDKQGPSTACGRESARVSGSKPQTRSRPMATTLNPYLNFDGNTDAAMKFYAEALNGKLEIMRFGDSPAPVPDHDKNKIMHAVVKTDAITIMASDTPDHLKSAPGSSVHLSLSFDNEPEQQRVW